MPALGLDVSFDERVERVESRPGYARPAAFAVGLASYAIKDLADPRRIDADSKVLDTWYPVVNLGENFGAAALLADVTGHRSGSASHELSLDQIERVLSDFGSFLNDGKRHPNIDVLREFRSLLQHESETRASGQQDGRQVEIPRKVVVAFIGDLQAGPVDAHDVYLRLHLLSHRKVKPHGLNLDGIFGHLNTAVWTSVGPFDPDGFEFVRARLRARGVDVRVHSVDKFPRMTDYVVPPNVRIADADRVRLGAHLADGTTVMHEGFCNFNAGTLGASMVEGRISAGVVVGAGSDVGGGASIMGTLSGGGKEVIRVGENCLISANAGIGISLGNGCTVEAGLYVTAGSKVKVMPEGRVVKARELSGKDDLRFWRDSQTGAIEVWPKKNQVILNEALHAN